MRNVHIFSFLFILLAGLTTVPAQAGSDTVQIKKSDDPKSITKGEVRFQLNSDYCKVLIDGEEWEDQEFYNNGKAVVMYGVDRTTEHLIKLTPAYPKLAPVEVKITPKMWKIVRFKRGIKVWRATKKIRFKNKAGKKKK